MATTHSLIGILLGCLLLVALMPSTTLAQTTYYLSGNASVSDPDGTLHYRAVNTYNNSANKVWGFQSISASLSGFSFTVDTLAGLVEYNAIPVTVLAYFDAAESFTDPTAFSVTGGT